MVDCPICGKSVKESQINAHIDSGCELHADTPNPSQTTSGTIPQQVSSFFKNPVRSTNGPSSASKTLEPIAINGTPTTGSVPPGSKRPAVNDETLENGSVVGDDIVSPTNPPSKRLKPTSALQRAAPLAERMRPRTLDDVHGQELVGPDGVLRGLIETDRVPSMILWGGAGTGKTTIARVIANM
ncbi:MAG: hypothetical protein Q9183_004436, partial [Haloplaca sp. 2 TL-2023]